MTVIGDTLPPRLREFHPVVGLKVLLPKSNAFGLTGGMDEVYITRVYQNGDFIASETMDNGICAVDTTTGGVIIGGSAREIHPRNPKRYPRTFNKCF